MDLADGPPSVEVDLAHEHCSFELLIMEEAALLHPEVLVPCSEACCGARGGRMPLLASDAILDFRLYLRLSQTSMMTNSRRVAHW